MILSNKSTLIALTRAIEIIDSRGNPTIRTKIVLKNGMSGIASVPSGASIGAHEAKELRDNARRYHGLGVQKAIRHVNTTIHAAIVNKDCRDQTGLDRAMIAMDNTPNKSSLGANAILSVSLAIARAAACANGLSLVNYLQKMFSPSSHHLPKLPRPFFNVINGGKHADSEMAIQEFWIVPRKKSIKENIRIASEIFHTLQANLKKQKKPSNVGDEGGFAVAFKDPDKIFSLLSEAVSQSGYRLNSDIQFGIDAGASEWYLPKEKKYLFNKKSLSPHALVTLYDRLITKWPIAFIEDGCAENDWTGWKLLHDRLGDKAMLIGDDLFATSKERLEKGISLGVANGVIIKLNQIGTLTETFETVRTAKESNIAIVVSHRSGETCDSFISDMAVALNGEYVKMGSVCRGERTEKYNRLIEIEENF